MRTLILAAMAVFIPLTAAQAEPACVEDARHFNSVLMSNNPTDAQLEMLASVGRLGRVCAAMRDRPNIEDVKFDPFIVYVTLVNNSNDFTEAAAIGFCNERPGRSHLRVISPSDWRRSIRPADYASMNYRCTYRCVQDRPEGFCR